MEEDDEGNNAIHYAVIYQSCLTPLLEAIRVHSVPCDIDAFNNGTFYILSYKNISRIVLMHLIMYI